MSLKIDSTKVVLPDQTPTPTRFLKLIDQEGLFDTLKDSPFDQVRSVTMVTCVSAFAVNFSVYRRIFTRLLLPRKLACNR